MLLVSQQVARPPDLQVAHGDGVAGTEVRELLQGLEPPPRILRKPLQVGHEQVAEGMDVGPAHASPQLVHLGESELVGVHHADGVHGGDVQPRLHDGGGDQDVELARQEGRHDLLQLVLLHLAVADADAGLRDRLLDGGGQRLQAVDARSHDEHLASAADLVADRFGQGFVVEVSHPRLHGQPVARRGGDDGDVARSGEGHVQGAGDGRGGEGQHVHVVAHLLEPLLLLHPELLLLVQDQKSEVAEFDVLGQHPVGAHHHVHLAVLHVLQDPPLFLGRHEAVEKLHADRPVGEAVLQRGRVLGREQGGGGEDGGLAPPHDHLEQGPHGHLGLAEPDVAAHQAIGGMASLQVALDLAHGAGLVRGEFPGERILEFCLEVVVRGERIALGDGPLGVELHQLPRHLLHGLARLLLQHVPGPATQLVQGGRFAFAAAVALQAGHLRDGHAQPVLAVVLEDQHIHFLSGRDDAFDAQVLAHAVDLVDHEVALLERLHVGEARRAPRASLAHAPGEAMEDLVVGPPRLSVLGQGEARGEMSHRDSLDREVLDEFFQAGRLALVHGDQRKADSAAGEFAHPFAGLRDSRTHPFLHLAFQAQGAGVAGEILEMEGIRPQDAFPRLLGREPDGFRWGHQVAGFPGRPMGRGRLRQQFGLGPFDAPEDERRGASAQMVQEGPVQRCEEGPLPGPTQPVPFVLQALPLQFEAPVLSRESLQDPQQPVLQGLLVGKALVQGEDFGLFQVLETALREQVEGAEGLDFVAQEFGAHGVVHPVPEDVHDSPAHGEGAHLLAEGFFPVPQAGQGEAQLAKVGEGPLAHDQGLPAEGSRFRQLLAECGVGGHHKRRTRLPQGVQGGQPALQRGTEGTAPFVGLEFQGGEGQYGFVAQECAEIVPQPFHLAGVRGEDQGPGRGASGKVVERDGHGRRGTVQPGDPHPGGRWCQGAQRREQGPIFQEIPKGAHGLLSCDWLDESGGV